MKAQGFYGLLNRGKSPDASMRFALRAVVDRYPYFQIAIFTYLKCLYAADDKMFASELQRLAVFVADKKALFYYILNEDYEKFFKRKGKRRELAPDRTSFLLNAFFENTDDGMPNMKPEKNALESNMVTYDYFSFIDSPQNKSDDVITPGRQPGYSPMKHQNLIDNFLSNAGDSENMRINAEPEPEPVKKPVTEPEREEMLSSMPEDLQDDFFFTETLANIYIKQHKYQKAYEIIKQLNLKFPEKNIYFASQISFLEKLIENEKTKK